jgi:hypothetical protein
MVRMDNLSAVIMTSRVFSGSSNGFHGIYPASFIPSQGGGGMDRNQVALSIGIQWRIASEYASDKIILTFKTTAFILNLHKSNFLSILK